VPEYPNTPRAVADVHRALWPHVVDLQGQWNTFRRLFMTNDGTVDVLNWAARGLFAKMQRSLVDEMILAIARLTDPPQTGSHKNVVLERLAQECDAAGRKDVGEQVRRCLHEARKLSAAMRDQRNRRLGHLDFTTHVEQQSVPAVFVREISGALRWIKAAMNSVEVALEGRTTMYSAYSVTGDAGSLVHVLRAARESDERDTLFL
jgi:hypothetical protein